MYTSDNELLRLYVDEQDQLAFERMTRRHSAMVYSVCRGLLWRKEDAEDAFQAVFIVLSNKAPKLIRHNSIGGWLHETATRTCLQLRRKNARNREVAIVNDLSKSREPWQSITESQNLETLHHEISRLPQRYREVIVLYHLEGKSRAQIAGLLDCTTAAVKAALARGRNLLRRRLLQRGVTASIVLAGAVKSSQHVQADSGLCEPLIRSTLDLCQGLKPTHHVGNGPEFVESLLAKETTMSLGTLHSVVSSIVGAAVVGAATMVAFAQTPTPVSSGVVIQGEVSTVKTVPSVTVVGQPATTVVKSKPVYGITSSQVQGNISIPAVANMPSINLTGPIPVPVSGSHAAPRVFSTYSVAPTGPSVQTLRFDGKQLTHAVPNLIAESKPHTIAVDVTYVENGQTKVRKEERTQTVHTSRLDDTNPTKQVPLPVGFVLQSLDGHVLSVESVSARIGDGELSVVFLDKNRELPETWRTILRSDVVIVRHDGHRIN